MQLEILTSSSVLNTINDFQYIYDLAKCSKCQIFALLKSTNKLYGAIDDCSSIHEIDVPFLVNTDLEFYFDPKYRDLIPQFEGFFVPAQFPWVIIPTYYWEMYLAGDIISQYIEEEEVFVLFDKSTMQRIPQVQMYKKLQNYDRQRMYFIRQLEGLFNRMPYLGPIHTFENMHLHPTIKEAYDAKAAAGRFLCRFTNASIDVMIYFYKSMFSLSKSDTLDIDIRFDLFNTKEFLAIYRPKKKKNPVSSNRYGVPYIERIYCMYLNII